MFLFEKSLIDVYCNWLYNKEKGLAFFRAMAELKQTAPAKILIPTNVDTKAGPQNCQIGLPLNSSFL